MTVRDGRATGLRGNREHPYTRGALCVKVNQYLEHTRAPGRLMFPLRRVGAKGEDRFERIGWDEALAEIAARLRETIDTHGGEAIWPYQGTGTLGYLQGLQGRAGSRLWNVLGASRHRMTICASAGSAGLRYTQGTSQGMDPEDLRHSRLILLWGTNTLTTGHHLWRLIQEARTKGAYVVAIDPVRTRTAEQADEHLPIRPGDRRGARARAAERGRGEDAEDDAYLARHTVGWERFRSRIEEFPPSRAASITGLPTSGSSPWGDGSPHAARPAIRCTMGMQRHAGGGNALRLLYALPGVTGDWQYPGGGLHSPPRRSGADLAALRRDDLLRTPYAACP